MITTTLNANNEYTQSVTTSVPTYLLSSGDDMVRKIDIPSWNIIRVNFKYTLVGGLSNTAGLFFYGICSGAARSRNKTNQQHCIGWQNNVNLQPPDPFWHSLTSTDTDPPNSIYGWTTAFEPCTVVTGSIQSTGGFTGGFVPRYETVWSSSYKFSSQTNNQWSLGAIEIQKPGFSESSGHVLYGVEYQIWGGNAGYTANVPRGPFQQARQQNRMYIGNNPGIYEGAISEWGVTRIGNGGTRLGVDQPGINESVYGKLDSLNFYWTVNTPSAKIAIRDIAVMVTDYDVL
jgi:hypothetical protein